jgi:hypothetical protein
MDKLTLLSIVQFVFIICVAFKQSYCQDLKPCDHDFEHEDLWSQDQDFEPQSDENF